MGTAFPRVRVNYLAYKRSPHFFFLLKMAAEAKHMVGGFGADKPADADLELLFDDVVSTPRSNEKTEEPKTRRTTQENRKRRGTAS